MRLFTAVVLSALLGSCSSPPTLLEQIILSGPGGATLRDFTYDDSPPWPTAADGYGVSLQLGGAELEVHPLALVLLPRPVVIVHHRPQVADEHQSTGDEEPAVQKPRLVEEAAKAAEAPAEETVEAPAEEAAPAVEAEEETPKED